MTGFLIDEMFPAAAAELLRDNYQHDAVRVGEIGLRAVADALVAATARAQNRAGWSPRTSPTSPQNAISYWCSYSRRTCPKAAPKQPPSPKP